LIRVEQWAEIRRMHFVERLSIKEIHRRTGRDRKTIRRALRCEVPPRYRRPPRLSKLDPFRDEIDRLLRLEPRLPGKRIRELIVELGYEGGKTILDDYLREVRPRYLPRRTYQRTVYRPGELVQFDLFEPREPIPVGHGQVRRGWVVTAELCWSRALAGALVFSKQAPDLIFGMNRCLGRLGALPEKLVWDREGAIHAGGGRPTEEFAAFCGQLAVGWIILDQATPRPRVCSSARIGLCARTSNPAAASARSSTSRPSSTAGPSGRMLAPTAASAPSRPSGSKQSGRGCGRCPGGCPSRTAA
jgi:hypothetical protein